MKKTLLILVLLAAAGGAAWWKWSDPAPKAETAESPPEEETTIRVARGDLVVTVEATGRVVPEQEVEIKCKASGEVTALPVDVSDPVQKGDMLVQLDPEEEERSLRRAEVALAVSESRKTQAELDLRIAERNLETERTRAGAARASAEANLREARSRRERLGKLFEKKVIAREEFEAAETAEAEAEANLENARARVTDLETVQVELERLRQAIRIAEAQVETDKISLSDARQRLDETRVTAPISGVVAEKNIQAGQIISSGINSVSGGTTLMTLADLSRVYILVAVDESDIGRVEVDQPARITVDAHPAVVFPGQVVRVATKGVVTSNVVTFEVKVEVKGPDRKLLKPEMTANVEILAIEKRGILLLPVNAIARRGEDRFATVLRKDGTSEKRPLRLGVSDGEKIEILEGLAEGEGILPPEGGPQSRWRTYDAARKDARNKARQQNMRMRMLSGGRGRR